MSTIEGIYKLMMLGVLHAIKESCAETECEKCPFYIEKPQYSLDCMFADCWDGLSPEQWDLAALERRIRDNAEETDDRK